MDQRMATPILGEVEFQNKIFPRALFEKLFRHLVDRCNETLIDLTKKRISFIGANTIFKTKDKRSVPTQFSKQKTRDL